MKNLILALIVLFSVSSFAQTTYYDEVNGIATVDFGTVVNSVTETGYVNLSKLGYARIDSISVTAYGTGELDVDSVDFYVGVSNVATGLNKFSSTAITQAVTINVAAGADAFEQLYTSDATALTGDVLRGVNVIKVVTRGATSGNDATDPNRLVFDFKVWGDKDNE